MGLEELAGEQRSRNKALSLQLTGCSPFLTHPFPMFSVKGFMEDEECDPVGSVSAWYA